MKKDNKWQVFLITSIAFLIIIQVLFSIPAPWKWLDAVWEAGDLISFVGTIVLGYVATSQTQRANKMSENLIDIEKSRYILEIRPFVIVTDCKAYELCIDKFLYNPDRLYIQIGSHLDGEPTLGIGLRLQNTTNSFLTAEYSSGYSNKVTWSNSTTNQPNRKICLLAGDSKEVIFYANAKYIESLVSDFITIEFILENRFSERYKESFKFIITALSNTCIHKDGEWYCSSITQNYTIGKFAKDGDGKSVLNLEEI